MKHLGRGVVVFENMLSDIECNMFKELIDDNPKLNSVYDDNHYAGNTTYQGFTMSLGLSPNIEKIVKNCVASAINQYCDYFCLPHQLGDKFEQLEIMKFETGKGVFDQHFDSCGDDHYRQFAFIWYLNDVEKGGELHLPSKIDYVTIQPKQGRLVMMPTDWTHYHFVTMPESNHRYSMITFIRY